MRDVFPNSDKLDVPEASAPSVEAGRRHPVSAQALLYLVEPLQPGGSATTVREPNGEVLVTDGPFAETKEQLLG